MTLWVESSRVTNIIGDTPLRLRGWGLTQLTVNHKNINSKIIKLKTKLRHVITL